MTYTTTKDTEKNWRVDSFDSLDSLLKTVDTKPSPAWKCGHQSRSGDYSFTKTQSWGECLNIARTGWKEGRDKITAQTHAATLVNPSISHMAEALDVAGNYPIVPVYVAGDMECMASVGESELRTKPVVRFIVSISASAMVANDVIVNRGAAILSWVDKLEAEGIRCEIYAIETCHGGSNFRYTVGCNIKRADEPLELDRLAFVLSHPSMLRRLAFACVEMHEDCNMNLGASYGRPANDIPDSLKTSHSVYFPCMHGHDSAYANAESAVAKVREVIAEGLKNEDCSAFTIDLQGNNQAGA